MGKVLLFHVHLFKANQILALCKKTNHTAQLVTKAEYGKSIGALAGIMGMDKKKGGSGKEFDHEMMVFSEMDSKTLDDFLVEYKKAGIAPIKRKAIITPSNVSWTAEELYEELDEHERRTAHDLFKN